MGEGEETGLGALGVWTGVGVATGEGEGPVGALRGAGAEVGAGEVGAGEGGDEEGALETGALPHNGVERLRSLTKT